MEPKQAQFFGLASAEGQVPGLQPPARRPLKIFAFDPSLARSAGNLAIVEITNEDELGPGPNGRLVRVVDYDAAKDVWYPAVDLDDAEVLMQRGLDPSDSDPRFHQQMVYAVVMKVIENFERALGRPFRWTGDRKLTVLPHAFEGENAFYDPATKALYFGYFTADPTDPGPNLPGQTVFTCLSHDIVAHETTHAVIDRLRDHFNAPTNPDVLAFHEGLADVVAIFQHFSFPEVLRHQISATRADISKPGRLLELARQFGYATGSGRALRTVDDADADVPHGAAGANGANGSTRATRATGTNGEAGRAAPPDPTLYQTTLEAHDRGSILVAAVFDAFFRIYDNRIRDLVRAATGGSGVLPEGELQADLVNLATKEAAQAAQDVLTMCLRAFEYLPPVDVTFGDYLRAIVTADFELNPRDEFERRASFIDAFRARGVFAPNVSSLAEEALRLDRPVELEAISIAPGVVTDALVSQFDFFEGGRRRQRPGPDPKVLHAFAMANAPALQLDPAMPIEVEGFHPSFHVDESGQLRVELMARWVQTPKPDDPRRVEIGGVVLRAGTTAVFGADGRVRYVASRPLPGDHLAYETHKELAASRVDAFRCYVADLDDRDPLRIWGDDDYVARRMARRATLAAAHREHRSWKGPCR